MLTGFAARNERSHVGAAVDFLRVRAALRPARCCGCALWPAPAPRCCTRPTASRWSACRSASANVEAKMTPTSYSIDAHAKITGLAYLFSRARGASTGHGAIVDHRIVAGDFRHHRRQRQHDAHDPHVAVRQRGDRGRHLAALRRQARSRAARPKATSKASSIRSAPSSLPVPAKGPRSAPPPAIARFRSSTATPASTSI